MAPLLPNAGFDGDEEEEGHSMASRERTDVFDRQTSESEFHGRAVGFSSRRTRLIASLLFGAVLAATPVVPRSDVAVAEAEPSLDITKSSTAGDTVGPGDDLTYTVTVTNDGGSAGRRDGLRSWPASCE